MRGRDGYPRSLMAWARHRSACVRRVGAAVGVLALAAVIAPSAEAANGWRPTGALATARADHTATLLPNGKVLVAGGRNSEPLSTPLGSSELYDPATGKWTATGALSVARDGHTATLLTGPGCTPHCGKVLVAGGRVSQVEDATNPGTEVTASAELYDPATGTWSPTGSLPVARAFHTASLLHGTPCEVAGPPTWCGRVLVAGGEQAGTPNQLAGSALFDPATGGWSPTGSLATARRLHSATVLRDGTVLVVGGRNTPADGPLTDPVPTAERFDPATGTWGPAGSPIIRRAEHTATLLADGRVLVVGGLDAFLQPRLSAEVYDPATPANPWPASPVIPAMTDARARHTATLFPDGSLLVVGGGAENLDRSSTERFTPSPPGWKLDAPLATSRQRHTATLLTGPGCEPRCGELLVAGGLRQASTFLASAELYGVLPPPPPAPTYPVPRTVTDLTARARSARQISLTFSAPSPTGQATRPATRYVIKQSRSPITAANFSGARSLCGGTCSFTPGRAGDRITLSVNDLVPDRLYHYALRPLDAAGRPGALSNATKARTAKDRLRPGRPRGLSARAIGRGRVRLRFRAPASDGRSGPPVRRYIVKQATRPIRGARGFRRARSLCRSSCRFGARRVGARLTLTVRRLCPGRRYYYAIRAKDEGGNVSRVARFKVVRARGPRGTGC